MIQNIEYLHIYICINDIGMKYMCMNIYIYRYVQT